jgi:hypothetical protein
MYVQPSWTQFNTTQPRGAGCCLSKAHGICLIHVCIGRAAGCARGRGRSRGGGDEGAGGCGGAADSGRHGHPRVHDVRFAGDQRDARRTNKGRVSCADQVCPPTAAHTATRPMPRPDSHDALLPDRAHSTEFSWCTDGLKKCSLSTEIWRAQLTCFQSLSNGMLIPILFVSGSQVALRSD